MSLLGEYIKKRMSGSELEAEREGLHMKKVGSIALLIGILLGMLSFSEAFGAGTFTAFGPKDYIRTTGKPIIAMENFSVL
jgi:hypothetical protein